MQLGSLPKYILQLTLPQTVTNIPSIITLSLVNKHFNSLLDETFYRNLCILRGLNSTLWYTSSWKETFWDYESSGHLYGLRGLYENGSIVGYAPDLLISDTRVIKGEIFELYNFLIAITSSKQAYITRIGIEHRPFIVPLENVSDFATDYNTIYFITLEGKAYTLRTWKNGEQRQKPVLWEPLAHKCIRKLFFTGLCTYALIGEKGNALELYFMTSTSSLAPFPNIPETCEIIDAGMAYTNGYFVTSAGEAYGFKHDNRDTPSDAVVYRIDLSDKVTKMAVGMYSCAALTEKGELYQWSIPNTSNPQSGIKPEKQASIEGEFIVDISYCSTVLIARSKRGKLFGFADKHSANLNKHLTSIFSALQDNPVLWLCERQSKPALIFRDLIPPKQIHQIIQTKSKLHGKLFSK